MSFIEVPTYEVKYEEVNVFTGGISNDINIDYPILSNIYDFLIEGKEPKKRTNLANEYKLLAIDFFRASYNVLQYVVNNRSYGDVIDNCSLPMLFTIRHAIELAIKAAILKQNKNAKSTQTIFQNHDHNIKELYDILITKPENHEWLTNYFENMMIEDPSESLFRYSLDTTFRNKHHSIDSIRTTFISVYAFDTIIRFYFNDYIIDEESEKDYKTLVTTFSKNGEYLIEPSDGLEPMYTWQINDRDLFKQIIGFRDAGKVLYICKNNNIESLDLPIIYVLRHSLEISLKSLINELHGHIKNELKKPGIKDIPPRAYGTHDFDKIWKPGKTILEFFVKLYRWDTAKLDEIEKAILYIHNIDKKAEYFRYPTDKTFSYNHHNNIDFDKAYRTFLTLIEVMENIEYCISDLNDSVNEMLSMI